jgi:hypothetical protein
MAAEEAVPAEGAGRHPAVPEAVPETETSALFCMFSDEFPDEALALVCRFCDSQSLGRLACVSRRFTSPSLKNCFGGRGARLSPIDEGARLQLQLAAGPAQLVAGREQPVGGAWRRTLWRERPNNATWSACHSDVDLSEDGTLATNCRGDSTSHRFAVCGSAVHVMDGTRRFYAEFTVVKKANAIAIGVVQAGPRQPSDVVRQDAGWPPWCTHMWHHDGSYVAPRMIQDPETRHCYVGGDTIGLLLDVQGSTLTAFKNGARLGLMPWEHTHTGVFYWAVDLKDVGDSVRIDATKPSPPPTKYGYPSVF